MQRFMVLIGVLIVSGIAFAQEIITQPDELVTGIQQTILQWSSLGWIGVVTSVIFCLLLVLRYKPIDTIFEENNWKQYKPYIALVLGLLGGFFSSYATGESWGKSIVAGIIAGILSPGLHQVLTLGNKK